MECIVQTYIYTYEGIRSYMHTQSDRYYEHTSLYIIMMCVHISYRYIYIEEKIPVHAVINLTDNLNMLINEF